MNSPDKIDSALPLEAGGATPIPGLTRRQALVILGATGMSTLAGCPTETTGDNSTTNANTNSGDGTPSCVLTPEATEGPYFVDELLNRSDIRSDTATGDVEDGVRLRLRITVYQKDSGACSALEGAVVDVWHCNAEGNYSDVAANSTVGRKFLRGYQTTDAAGVVEFTTIYPGWYSGRTVHIHFKIRVDDTEFTSQLYFDEDVTADVFAQDPYNSRGAPDTTNARDNIYNDETLLNLSADGDGYLATFDVALELE